jgi:hypothetical protein
MKNSKQYNDQQYLSVKDSILGEILEKVDIEPFIRSNRIELSKLSKSSPSISYLFKIKTYKLA